MSSQAYISEYIDTLSGNEPIELFRFMEENFMFYIDHKKLASTFQDQMSDVVKTFIFDLGESLISMNLLTETRERAFKAIKDVRKSISLHNCGPALKELAYKLTELAAKLE